MKAINVDLEKEEVAFLKGFISKGEKNAREISRAYILLYANMRMQDNEIARLLFIHRQKVWRTKRRYNKRGLNSALFDKSRSGQPVKYTTKHKAEIIAKACTTPPPGRKRWTLELITEEMRKEEGFETLNKESIRLILKKAKLSLG